MKHGFLLSPGGLWMWWGDRWLAWKPTRPCRISPLLSWALLRNPSGELLAAVLSGVGAAIAWADAGYSGTRIEDVMSSNAERGFRFFRKAAQVVRGPEQNHAVLTILSSLSFLCSWKEKGWVKLPTSIYFFNSVYWHNLCIDLKISYTEPLLHGVSCSQLSPMCL